MPVEVEHHYVVKALNHAAIQTDPLSDLRKRVRRRALALLGQVGKIGRGRLAPSG